METVQSKDGTPIALEKSGSGRALVLVNGAVSEKKDVTALRQRLEPSFTVVAYDRRGRGESGDAQPYSPEREIEDLTAVLDFAGGRDAFLFGHSSGGILALQTVMRGVSVRPHRQRRSRRVRCALFLTEEVALPAEAVQALRAAPSWTFRGRA
jgi:alpha-beta hydrolase superfamily lysophospholipase